MLPLLIKETRTPNSINIFRKVNAERIEEMIDHTSFPSLP